MGSEARTVGEFSVLHLLFDLLESDRTCRRFGLGLHPALRAALEKELSWPAHAASPSAADASELSDSLSDNVVRLETRKPDTGSRSA